MVLVLGSWVWQEGRDTAWWLGAIVEAQSAADAAQRVTSVVAARNGGVHTLAVTHHVTASTAHSTEELVAEEGSPSTPSWVRHTLHRPDPRPGVRPRRRAFDVEWTTSGHYELAHVTVAVTDFLTIGLSTGRRSRART